MISPKELSARYPENNGILCVMNATLRAWRAAGFKVVIVRKVKHGAIINVKG